MGVMQFNDILQNLKRSKQTKELWQRVSLEMTTFSPWQQVELHGHRALCPHSCSSIYTIILYGVFLFFSFNLLETTDLMYLYYDIPLQHCCGLALCFARSSSSSSSSVGCRHQKHQEMRRKLNWLPCGVVTAFFREPLEAVLRAVCSLITHVLEGWGILS